MIGSIEIKEGFSKERKKERNLSVKNYNMGLMHSIAFCRVLPHHAASVVDTV